MKDLEKVPDPQDRDGPPIPESRDPAVPGSRDGAVDRPRAGVRRWLSDTERAELTEHQAARTSLLRAIGEDSAAHGPVETWLNSIDSDNTRAAYAADARAFVEWLRDRHGVVDAPVNLLAVTMDVVAAYADAMREMTGRYGKPLGAKTRARRLSALAALYRHLVRRRIITANPVADLERPKYDKTGTTPARQVSEVRKLVEAAADNARDLLLVLLLYTSALRVTTVCRARVEDLVHDRGRRVLSLTTKRGRHLAEPLDPAVVGVLEVYLAGRTSGPLLLDDRGGPLQRHHVPPILRRLGKRAGVADPEALRPHVLRTTAATEWLEAGQPLQRVQHKLGHASSTTTEGYHRRADGAATDAALVAELTAALPIEAILDRLRARQERDDEEDTTGK